jgi:hypothetical protein
MVVRRDSHQLILDVSLRSCDKLQELQLDSTIFYPLSLFLVNVNDTKPPSTQMCVD